jgi:choline dehydrogenase
MPTPSHDFIIVGAGSAGCVLASRLSEDPSTRVLLLEAGGPDRSSFIHLPAAFSKLFRSEVDWDYHTEPQEHLDHRSLYWPRGRVLGGSSSINAMIYIRGHRWDYDHWAESVPGWSYQEVLPYFKRGEDQQRGPSEFHGAGGPLPVADLRSPLPLSRAFIAACLETGILANDDFNGVNQEGAGLYQATQKRGKRASAMAYLHPALARPNLTVLTEAQTTGILFEGTRARGVIYHRGGEEHQAQAGEVILCGGAINSPQLLLLSGIGPQEQLTEQEIPVIVDLPGVGKNLQDHPAIPVVHHCKRGTTLDHAENLFNLLKFLLFRRGPLTSNVGEAGAFVRSSPEIEIPDLQIHFVPAYYIEHGFIRPPDTGFTLGMCVLRPASRGEITLRSSDPLMPPLIEPNYLSEPGDAELLIESIHLARRIIKASALEPYRGGEHLPGEDVESAEEIARFLRTNLQTLYHPVGTCKMGNDAQAVVDAQLRVRGTEGLRVVDASIMPTLVGGNTNAPTMMIAEKGAAMILQDAAA